jgi:signal transduction histidine kinase
MKKRILLFHLISIQQQFVSLLEEVQRLSSISSQLAFLSKADAAPLSVNQTSVPMHELV